MFHQSSLTVRATATHRLPAGSPLLDWLDLLALLDCLDPARTPSTMPARTLP